MLPLTQELAGARSTSEVVVIPVRKGALAGEKRRSS